MPRGISFHVGVTHTQMLMPSAPGADISARRMKAIAGDRGFVHCDAFGGLLLDEHASLVNVRAAFDQAVQALAEGDLLWLSFAGHGLMRRGGDGREPRNQALALWDDLLVDDTIYGWLLTIRVKARVLFVVDACFSGSITDKLMDLFGSDVGAITRSPQAMEPNETRDFLRSPRGWRAFMTSFPRTQHPALMANVLLLASSDDQTTSVGSTSRRSATPFSAALDSVWRHSSDYRGLRFDLWNVLQQVPWAIEPVLNTRLLSDHSFVRERPFSP